MSCISLHFACCPRENWKIGARHDLRQIGFDWKLEIGVQDLPLVETRGNTQKRGKQTGAMKRKAASKKVATSKSKQSSDAGAKSRLEQSHGSDVDEAADKSRDLKNREGSRW
jgi:hypothetical protein